MQAIHAKKLRLAEKMILCGASCIASFVGLGVGTWAESEAVALPCTVQCANYHSMYPCTGTTAQYFVSACCWEAYDNTGVGITNGVALGTMANTYNDANGGTTSCITVGCPASGTYTGGTGQLNNFNCGTNCWPAGT